MDARPVTQFVLVSALGAALVVGNVAAQMLGNLFQMAGGHEAITKLAASFLQSSSQDSRLTGLMGKADVGALTPKVADQMCSMAGGACRAPLTDEQIKAGESKLDPTQKKALGDHFGSALQHVTDNSIVREGLSKVIAPKLGGIVGALL